METSKLQPIPSCEEVRPQAVLLVNYQLLYAHYFFGSQLPNHFPESILRDFPNNSCKLQLKEAIASQKAIVDKMQSSQKEFLRDYTTLYSYYAYNTPLPADFPKNILAQFPSQEHKQQLKEEMIRLHSEIHQENT